MQNALALISLSSSCSRSDFPITRQALAHLDSLPLMIWYSGLTALLLFLLEKAALAYLPTALSMALRPLFLFQQAQFVEVSLLKPEPFCTLFAGLGSTIKSVISLFFSFYVTLVLSSPPCLFLFSSVFSSITNSLADLARQTTMGPRTLVSPGERRG